jgi:hypothetical protein
MLADRAEFLNEVKARLSQAQEYARRYYDAHHRAMEFKEGDWLWLRMLNMPTHALVPGKHTKLSPKFVGPFQIQERIGAVAYGLQLPDNSRIHDVFHVGLLKPFHGTPPACTPPLPPLHNGRVLLQPERVLGSSDRRGSWHILVQWAGLPCSEATWEPLEAFRESFPSFSARERAVRRGRERCCVHFWEKEPRQQLNLKVFRRQ